MLNRIGFPYGTASEHAECQIALLSAGTSARRQASADQARKLAMEVNWSRLAGTLRARRLLGPLGPRILDLAQGQASEGFAAAVDQAIDSGRRHGAFLQLLALRLVGALADAGIRSTPLKGPFLGEAIYGDVGRRYADDVDLLVAPRQLRSAVDVVRTLGYRAPADHVEDGGLPLLHFALVHDQERLPPVELHWRIHWYEASFACERLLPPDVRAPAAWRPAPVDELASLLLFYARDGFIDLRLAADLGAWWDTFGSRVGGGALGELVGSHPALGRVLAAAANVAEKIVGLPPATQLFASDHKLTRRDRIAVRLANPNPHASHPQLYADMSLVDGLLAPPGGLGAFLRRQLLPPREVLSQRAQRTQSRRGTSRFGNGLRVLVRYGFTMARLTRPPEGVRLT
jgi:hypothetical protein